MADPKSNGNSLSSLEGAVALLASVELELETKGYPRSLIRTAISRARGTAEYTAGRLSEGIRDQGFVDLLAHELTKAESWLIREKRFIDGLGTPSSDEEGGD